MESIKRSQTWKKIVAALLVLTVIFALCGCVRYRATCSVNEDGTVTFYILYATLSTGEDDSLFSVSMTNEERQRLESEGWSVKPYTGEPSDEYDYAGYVVTKSGIKLEDLNKEVAPVEFGSQSLSGLKCTKKGELYTIDWDVTDMQSVVSDNQIGSDDMFSFGGFMEFVLKLPTKPLEDNATEKKGGTLTWKINDMNEPIHVEFKIEEPQPIAKSNRAKSRSDKSSGDGFPIWLGMTIIALVVAAAAVVITIVVIKTRESGKNKNNASGETTVEPRASVYTPQTPYGLASPYMPPQQYGQVQPYGQQPYAPQQTMPNAQYTLPPQFAQTPQMMQQNPYAMSSYRQPMNMQPMQNPPAPPREPTTEEITNMGLPQIGGVPSAGFGREDTSSGGGMGGTKW